MALIETSALDSSNVNLAFECIIKGKLVLYFNFPVLEIYKMNLSQSVANDDQLMKSSTLQKSAKGGN